MKTSRIFFPLFATILTATSLLNRPTSLSRAQGGQGGACCGPQHPVAPREVDFPYYSLRDGFQSSLLLVSDSPAPMEFVLAIHSLGGGTLLSPSMTIGPGAKLPIDLATLLTRLGADVTGEFGEGNVAVYFNGTIMALAGQLTMSNPARGLVMESEMVDNSPGLGLLPKQLDGLWWGIGGGRDARMMVTNTSGDRVTADVFLDFLGERRTSAPLTFHPHETKVLSIAALLGELKFSPAQAPQGGITIVQRGPHPSLIAQGRVLDLGKGFSSTLDFPSCPGEVSNTVYATGVPVGQPTGDSPYAGTGTFVPHVIVRNLSSGPQTVTVTVEYPSGSQWTSIRGPHGAVPRGGREVTSDLTGQFTAAALAVGPFATVDFTTDAILRELPLPLPFVTVRVHYSGAPGSMIAQVSSVEAGQDLVVDARVQDQANGWAGSGANPWHLDNQTESTLFLTDMGDRPVPIAFAVTANGVRYYLSELVLAPHETRAIDLRKLRDAQRADLKGNRIPPGATGGSVNWIRADNVPVMGQLLVLARHHGMASAYHCCTCGCPCNYVPGYMYTVPSSVYLVAGAGTIALLPYGDFQDCNGENYYLIGGGVTWRTNDTSVATVDATGHVAGRAGGATYVEADYDGCTDWESGIQRPSGDVGDTLSSCVCYAHVHDLWGYPDSAFAPAYVIQVQVTSVDLPSDQVRVTLSGPSNTSGELIVTWTGPSGNSPINDNTRGVGSYTFNPTLTNLVTGQYTGTRAQWNVSGYPTATSTRTKYFNVLGVYRHSQYNTPTESSCTGGPANALWDNPPTSCVYSTIQFRTDFIGQAWLNGSGISISNGPIQLPWGCAQPFPANSFKPVSQITGSCGAVNNGTVAAGSGAPVGCGDQVLIVGLGGGAGTLKSVTDSCPRCTGHAQLDNYTTQPACTVGSIVDLGNFQTIRVNR